MEEMNWNYRPTFDTVSRCCITVVLRSGFTSIDFYVMVLLLLNKWRKNAAMVCSYLNSRGNLNDIGNHSVGKGLLLSSGRNKVDTKPLPQWHCLIRQYSTYIKMPNIHWQFNFVRLVALKRKMTHPKCLRRLRFNNFAFNTHHLTAITVCRLQSSF